MKLVRQRKRKHANADALMGPRGHQSPCLLRAFAPSLVASLLAVTCHAAPPSLETLFPCGAKAGATVTITATGKDLEKQAPSVWADHPGITFKAGAKAKEFNVTVAPETPPGPHLVRFFNDEGASVPHVFVIGTHDEFADAEPNDDHLSPQVISRLPATIHGRLEKSGDVDTYAVKLEAGTSFFAEMQGYALGSQMDPAMKLLDARGVEVALSHDTHNLDPFIRHEVKSAGTYMVQVMGFAHPPAADVTLKGSPSHVYRLTLSDQPFPRAALPCAVTRGSKTVVSTSTGDVSVDATKALSSDHRIAVSTPHGEPVFVAVVDTPVQKEKQTAGNAPAEKPLEAPVTLCGLIAQPGETDRVPFLAKKGDHLQLQLRAAFLHSPLDGSLRIEEGSAKTLQQSDDSADTNPDPAVLFKATADGIYTAVISDLFQRGGSDYFYALEIAPPTPEVAVALTQDAIQLSAGKTAELKATVKVSGTLQQKMAVRCATLPAGVTMTSAEVPAKGGEVKLVLTAAADAPATGLPVEFLLSTSAPDAPITVRATYDLRGTEPRGDRLINDDSRVWLTLTSPVKPKPATVASPSGTAAPPAASPASKP